MRLVKEHVSSSGFLRIGELVKATGRSADTLRHYERKGVVFSGLSVAKR